MVPEDGEIDTNSATGTSCPTTSYSKVATAATTALIQKTSSGSSGVCSRIYLEFDLTPIPDDATITKVELVVQIAAATSAVNCDVRQMNDYSTAPRSDTAANVWTNAGDGTTYISNNNFCTTTGQKTLDLGSTAITDVSNARTASPLEQFSVGLGFNSETRDATTRSVTIAMSEHGTASNNPKLKVTFTARNSQTIILGGSATDLPEDGIIATDSANGSSCPSTSYSKTTNGLTDKVYVHRSNQAGVCQRAYFQWDTSGIASIATPNEIAFQYSVTSVANAVNCNIHGITASKPSSDAAASVWSNIASGTAYLSNNSFCTTVGIKQTILGSNANTDFTTMRANGYFALGIKANSESRSSNIDRSMFLAMTEDSTAADQKPRLVINYVINKGLAENLGAHEAPTKDSSKALAENLGLHDTVQSAMLLIKQLTDNLALSDSRTFASSKRSDENVGLSDSRTSDSSKSFSETVSFTDTKSNSAGKALFENLGSLDIVLKAPNKGVIEGLGLTDTYSTVSVFIREFAENLASADSSLNSVAKLLLESVDISDVRFNSMAQSLVENIGVSDDQLTATSFALPLFDNLSLDDEQLSNISKHLIEELEFMDNLEFGYELSKALSESLSLTDETASEIAKFMSESVSVMTANDQSVQFTAVLSEDLSLSDLSQAAVTFLQSLSETMRASDSLSLSVAINIMENLASADQKVTEVKKSLTETTAITVQTTTSIGYVKGLSESIDATEDLVFTTGKALIENIAIVDEISNTVMKSISEAVALGEQSARSVGKLLSEQIQFADISATAIHFVQAMAEDLAIDAVNEDVVAFGKLVNENLALAEVYTFQASISFMENLSTADEILKEFGASLDEGLAIGELATFSTSFVHSIGESLVLSDNISTVSDYIRSLSEEISATDEAFSEVGKNLQESLQISGEPVSLIGKAIDESLGISDLTTYSVEYITTVAENLGVSDGMASFANFVVLITEQISLEDLKSIALEFSQTLSENLSVDVLSQNAAVFAKFVGEGLAIGEGYSSEVGISFIESLSALDQVIKDFSVSANEELAIGEIVVSTASFMQSIGEILALADNTSTSASFLQSLSEGLSATDEEFAEVGKSFSEMLDITEIPSLAASFQKSFFESLDVSESMAIEFTKSISEALSIEDFAWFDLGINLSEALDFAEQQSSIIGKAIEESMSITDLRTSSTEFATLLVENLGASDALNMLTNFAVLMSETLSVEDLASTASQFTQNIVEALSLSELVSGTSGVLVELNEALAVTDSISSLALELNIMLTESIEIQDYISDVFIDIYFTLTESIAMVNSFFTPEIAYQSSLVTEGLGVSDTLELNKSGTAYEVSLTENVLLLESILSQMQTIETGSHHGSNLANELEINGTSAETIALSDSLELSLHAELSLEETLPIKAHVASRVPFNSVEGGADTGDQNSGENGSSNSSSVQPGALNMNISVTWDTISTISGLSPRAIAHATVELENEDSNSRQVVVHYWYVEKDDSDERLLDTLIEISLQPHQLTEKEIVITFDKPGNYTLVVSADSISGDERTGQIVVSEITVPWAAVFASPIILLSVGSAASAIVVVGLSQLMFNRWGKSV